MKSTPSKGINSLAFCALALALSAAPACKKAEAKTKGVGDNLRAFLIKNCADGKRYCQVCAYGGKPTIMAVVDLEDKGAEKDLVQIQKMLDANKDKGLTAFALYGTFKNGMFSPVKDDDAAAKKLKSTTERLGLSYPVTLLPTKYSEKELKSYTPFVDAYEVKKSRTLMLADAGNKVLWSATIADGSAETQYKNLETALKKNL